ncbi:hypothetical protein PITCH_A80025 [uncultured Desulfobacterium sp.]|uniref:Uncharacterized protein n=1 Tax=uncultured Desulfobacterium sp. TaxID=201089 RepID=A0A445N2T7_9BACT|nr:hypothetical protein PITCH_A80025 [uncultured Desulfobacterium sp.]
MDFDVHILEKQLRNISKLFSQNCYGL